MRKGLRFLLLFLMCSFVANVWAAAEEPVRKVLFQMNDHGSKYWRIPALVTANDGSLVAVVDKRGNALGDLPNKISIMAVRSTDNGVTWSNPVEVAAANDYGATYGDPAVVLDEKSGELVCMFVGDKGLWDSTPWARQNLYVSKSSDNGQTWTSPKRITDQVYNDHTDWYAGFAGSGHGLCTKNGRLMFVLAIRPTSAQQPPLHNYAIYSDDHGETWKLSENAATTQGDEAKVVELENGDILMSIRNPQKGSRMFSTSKDGGRTWTTAERNSNLKDPACNGDIIRYTKPDGSTCLLHSLPESATTRENVTIYLSEDNGKTWPVKKRLVNGYSAYSSMTVLKDGSIGILVEEGKWDGNLPGEDGFNLVFYRFTYDWLTAEAPKPPVLSEGTIAFNGTDRYMSIPNADELNIGIGQSFTVTCKVKMPFSGSACRFVSKRSYEGTDNSQTCGWELWGDKDYNTRFSTNLSPLGSPWGGKGNGTGVTFQENTWAHLTWVFDTQSQKTSIYVDGVLGEGKALAREFQSMSMVNNFPILVGAGYSNNNGSPSEPSYFMQGEMDDLRFYNKALTIDEIKADMKNTVDENTANLVAAYDFEKFSGNQVPDISGHGHNATLVNFPDYTELYTVNFAATDPARGTVKVMNGNEEVVNGSQVPSNTELTVIAEPADGYMLKQIVVNGKPLAQGINKFVLLGETTISVEFDVFTQNYCTYPGNSTHPGRYVRKVTMNGGVSPFSFNVHAAIKQPIYVDKTANVLEAAAGTEITPVVDWVGEWMHGYLYIDYDKNGEFDLMLGANGYPEANSEVVSYTFYNATGNGDWGQNSKGESIRNNGALHNVPSFTIPANLAAGEYRVRLKVDWNHLDPCGHPNENENLLTANGGNIVDFTLRVISNKQSYNVTYQAEGDATGTITLTDADKKTYESGASIEEDTELTATFAPAEDAILDDVKVNGVSVMDKVQNNVYTFTLTEATDIKATFAKAYAVTITPADAAQGTLKVLDGEAEVVSGSKVRANTELTVVAEAAAGYVLKQILVNDQPLESGVNKFTLTAATTVAAEFEEFVPNYCTYEGNSKHGSRYLNKVTMNGGLSAFSFDVHSTSGKAIYVDKTAEVLEATAGTEISPVINWVGEWMHGYLYIDYDKNGEFDLMLDENEYPEANSEVVSYTFYSTSDAQWGQNSKGDRTENNSRLDNVPSFTLPANLAPGDYRVRIKIDWCHLDPCGHPGESRNKLEDNGGNIVDFTLRVVDPSATTKYTVTLPANVEHGTLAVMNGTEALVAGENEVEANTELTITATPEEGYVLEALTVNGTDFTSGNTYTVTADANIAVSFVKAPVKNYMMRWNIEGDGEGTITVTDSEQNSYAAGTPVAEGTELTVTFTPAEHSLLQEAKINDKSILGDLQNNSYTFTVTEDFMITASYAATYEVTTSVKEGEGDIVLKVGDKTYPSGSRFTNATSVTAVFTPAEGFKIKKATLFTLGFPMDLTSKLEEGSYTFEINADVQLEAAFETVIGGVGSVAIDDITVNCSEGKLYVGGVTDNAYDLAVYSASGQLMLTSRKAVVNVEHLADGAYLAKVKVANGEKVVKFIKK